MKKIIAGAAIGAIFTIVALILAEEYKRWRASDGESEGCGCKSSGAVQDSQPPQDRMTTARQLRDQMREAEAIAFEKDQLEHTLATVAETSYPAPPMA